MAQPGELRLRESYLAKDIEQSQADPGLLTASRRHLPLVFTEMPRSLLQMLLSLGIDCMKNFDTMCD